MRAVLSRQLICRRAAGRVINMSLVCTAGFSGPECVGSRGHVTGGFPLSRAAFQLKYDTFRFCGLAHGGWVFQLKPRHPVPTSPAHLPR